MSATEHNLFDEKERGSLWCQGVIGFMGSVSGFGVQGQKICEELPGHLIFLDTSAIPFVSAKGVGKLRM